MAQTQPHIRRNMTSVFEKFHNLESVNAGNVKKKRSAASITKKVFSKKNFKNRFPIAKWLPSYSVSKLIQDSLAGVIVGATAVAQGIAYAAIAGLPTEYGLYSGIVGGFIYFIFGNCKNMSIGPTAIISALVSRYVKGMSPDFAVLLAFLTGVVQLVLAVFQLGFLVEFLSSPVISGFTTAAAIQICASQLKSFFGTKGASGNSFLEAATSLVENIKTVKLWDTVLGVLSLIMLIGFKMQGQGIKQTGFIRTVRRSLSLLRNLFVIAIGVIIAYILYLTSNDGLVSVIGSFNGGLPKFQVPPFSTTVGNETYSFVEMLQFLGPQSLVTPLVSIMEVVIISKAFTPDALFDGKQEMIALGFANLVGSFVGGMPVTGAFSRSALMEASNVQTPAAGIMVSCLMISSLSLMTSVFYFIPKSTLAAMIMLAVCALVDTEEIIYLWKRSKREIAVLIITVIAGLTLGLEYGVIFGVIIDLLTILFRSARPLINVRVTNFENQIVVLMRMPENVLYCSGEYLRRTIIRKLRIHRASLLIIDGTYTDSIDTTVISNLMSMLNNLESTNNKVVFANFNEKIRLMCIDKDPKHENKFMSELEIQKLICDEPITIMYDD